MRILRLVFCIFIIIGLAQSGSADILRLNGNNLDIKLDITSGSYSDADSDNTIDDVVVEMVLELYALETLGEAIKKENFKITLDLTLPSGYTFSYTINAKNFFKLLDYYLTNIYDDFYSLDYAKLNLKLLFLNHALESGYYKFDITIDYNRNTHPRNSLDLIFDPPGTTDGDPPMLLATAY